ncbi:MAG: hypothetical protein JO266_09365 [Acidobacteria bacterium]|nr:hypothetical protein [Acidobacteriota bacterium]MBV8892158.1 hypothetical protein [Acidobacteriota bacterium]
MKLAEGIMAGLDTVATAAVLACSVFGSLADIFIDVLAGRQIPEPDLKTVAEAPEPGAVSRVRPPKNLPRTSRSTVRREEAA